MACHHAPERLARGCGGCHDEPPGPLQATPSRVRGGLEPTAGRVDVEGGRSLPFDHGRHRAVPCASCHDGEIGLGVDRSCDSCHERHHRPDASCATCHEAVRARHEADAHLGCGGPGCHTSPTVLALPETRNVCLTCHADRAEHEPGGECAACHPTGRGPAPEDAR